jgi:hypothetical protein
MTFVHPAFLFALALGLIPILIYYLIRFRSLRVDWGATYVLERALNRLRRKVYLEQLLLLALRVLVVLLLVALFARPVSTARRRAATGGGTHRVVVLDISYSMLAGEAGATSWDRALAATRALVGSWGRGERWSLCLAGATPRWLVDDQAVDTPERTQALLAGLQPDETSTALANVLETVLQKSGGRETEVYIAADDQASTWQGVEQIALPASPPVRFYWLRPPSPGSDNLAVTRLRLNRERALLRHPCRVFTWVRNFGTAPAENVDVELLVDDAFYARETLSLLPGQESLVHFDVTFDEPGSHSLVARLRRDVLDFDNSAAAAAEAVPALSVLVLRDPAKSDKFASAAGFLELAARVMTRRNAEDAPLFTGGLLDVRPLDSVAAADALAGADVVVVDGGCPLSPALVQALLACVRSGGGLLLAADDGIDLTAWNDLLGPAGLLPAPLLAVRREALGGERFASVSRAALDALPLKALETLEDGDIAHSRLYSWVELGPPAADATVLAWLAERQPFAVARSCGAGRVVLLATGLNSRNNNLMVREFTYPLLLNLFSEAAAGGLDPRTVATRQPIRLRSRDAEPPAAAQFSLGQQPPVVVTPQPLADGALVELPEGSDRSGLGSLLLTWKDRHRRVWVGVQGERSDSDLRPLSPAARQRIAEHLGLTEAGSWEELQALLEAGYRGAEWHHWAAMAVLLALVGEMLLQRRFV